MNTHDAMRIVTTNYTVNTQSGTYVFSRMQIKGMRVRVPVLVKAPSKR